MWRAAYPEANASEIPSAESLPRLFSNVVGLHIRRVDDGYVFMDPTRRDENGDPAPEPGTYSAASSAYPYPNFPL